MLLKFYADWALHHEKDQLIPEIERMAGEQYAAAVKQLATGSGAGAKPPEFVNFASMAELRAAMTKFFQMQGLSDAKMADVGQ